MESCKQNKLKEEIVYACNNEQEAEHSMLLQTINVKSKNHKVFVIKL